MKHGESLLTFAWQKAHEEHLHQVQCNAACLGWHMAVHRRLGVSPVWAEGQVAGRPYPICARAKSRAARTVLRQVKRRIGQSSWAVGRGGKKSVDYLWCAVPHGPECSHDSPQSHDMYFTQAASTLIWENFQGKDSRKASASHARRGPACVQAPCTCRPRSELAVPQRPAASARHGPRASAPPELPAPGYGFLHFSTREASPSRCGLDPLKPYTGHKKNRARAEDCPRSLPLD